MSNTIFGLANAAQPAPAAAARTPLATQTAQHSGPAPDRIVLQGNQLPTLLTIGAATVAQLVPGVIEAEGAASIASAFGIGLRAVAANPALSFAGGVAASGLTDYAKTLVHDAAIHQPSGEALAAIGHAVDSDIRRALGIAPGEPR